MLYRPWGTKCKPRHGCHEDKINKKLIKRKHQDHCNPFLVKFKPNSINLCLYSHSTYKTKQDSKLKR